VFQILAPENHLIAKRLLNRTFVPLKVETRRRLARQIAKLAKATSESERSAWGQPFIYDFHGEGEGAKAISPQRILVTLADAQLLFLGGA
jgi:hypothetical protein